MALRSIQAERSHITTTSNRIIQRLHTRLLTRATMATKATKAIKATSVADNRTVSSFSSRKAPINLKLAAILFTPLQPVHRQANTTTGSSGDRMWYRVGLATNSFTFPFWTGKHGLATCGWQKRVEAEAHGLFSVGLFHDLSRLQDTFLIRRQLLRI